MQNEAITTHPVKLALAWGFVGIPLVWGVYMTLQSAMALFG
ncbi:MFS transporter small subunit [Aureimonas glaciei]|jgi:hypothetical protein|uniref:Oxalate:formate antiporter n=1 Tax=Aureimonas glaciei TaxID=1776957 RepID=A0A917D6Y2_9HYPH|nr:hypothetical protein [Aureimonas glaciei]GGD04785.1 hypothetical protein GCM10011335_04480 [Aureimonas glaciei]